MTIHSKAAMSCQRCIAIAAKVLAVSYVCGTLGTSNLISATVVHTQPTTRSVNDALIDACSSGDLDAVKASVRDGADIEYASGKSQLRPLMIASANGRFKVVNYLLQNGADFRATAANGFTALHCAALAGCFEATIYLKQDGADVNARADATFGHVTPLIIAVEQRGQKVAFALLDGRADPNLTRDDGATALHIAVHLGYTEMVEMLLHFSCDSKIKNNEGKTAIDIAIEDHRDEIAKILRSIPTTQPSNREDEHSK